MRLTLLSLVCLYTLLSPARCGAQTAQSRQSGDDPGYWFPGGVKLLNVTSQDSIEKIQEFPDNKEARSWFVGFWKTLDSLCPATGQTQSHITRMVFTLDTRGHDLPGLSLPRSTSEYINEAQPVRPEGGDDARLLSKTLGCANVQNSLYNSIRTILHKSVSPEPTDLPRFLALASPGYRQALGYTEAQVYALMHPAPKAPPLLLPVDDGTLKTSHSQIIGFPQTSARLGSRMREQEADLAAAKAAGQLTLTCNYGLRRSPYPESRGGVIKSEVSFWYKTKPAGIEAMLSYEEHPFKNLGTTVVTECPKTYEEARSALRAGLAAR